jgi:hypothetical protein
MPDDLRDLMGDGFAAPLGDVIAAVGRGVAEAQAALDRGSLEATLAVYDIAKDGEGDAGAQLLREIGYRPTFYVLPETSCEVQVSMRVGGSGGADGSANGSALGGARTYVTPLDAGFANRFSYAANASAKLTFKIVPVPPPAALDENRPAPQLLHLNGSQAAARLDALGLTAVFVDGDGKPLTEEFAGDWEVTAQTPAAMGLVPLGEAVRLVLTPGS